MQIVSINGPSFRRAFSTKEKEKADKLRTEALKVLDCDKIIFILPETSFPSETNKNIGIGQLNSKYNDKFYDFLKTYTGANSIKVLPSGEYVKSAKHFFCNYRSTSLTFGTHNINPEELTASEMGKILSPKTLDYVYEVGNQSSNNNMAIFENAIGPDSRMNKALFEAYKNFKCSNQLQNEQQLFEKFKQDNFDIIEKRALFECLRDEYGTHFYSTWGDTDKNLFNTDVISDEVREKRIQEIKSKHSEKIDFIFFKQYLAEKNIKKARENLHKKGMTLTGDCLIGFATDELWAYPKAFEEAKICSKDWGLIALNFADITKDGSESNKLLKKKIEHFAKYYDNIRFDVGWAYINPILYPKHNKSELLKDRYIYDSNVDGYRVKEPLNDTLLNMIEDVVRQVQGSNYKKENLFYEVSAGKNEFAPYDWNSNTVIKPLDKRTIVQSTLYMDSDYATIEQLENRMKISRDNYIIMAGNHDNLSLNSLAKGIDTDGVLKYVGDDIKDVRERQIKPLSKKFNIDENILKTSPEEFIKVKFAYNFLGRNLKMFFMDVFGRSEQFDSQIHNSSINYRYRISSDYETEFHRSLQNKQGLNIMDAMAKAMKAKGLDKSNKQLYKDLVKYSKILYKKGALTEVDANKNIKKLKYMKIFSGLLTLSAIVFISLKFFNKIQHQQTKNKNAQL